MTDRLAVIQTEGLSKQYRGGTYALRDLNLTIERGEVFGYLGPNGAGKTTTIRLLLDLLRPSAGRARVFGSDVTADGPAVRAKIGYLPGELNVWDTLTARQVIQYMGRVRGGVNQTRVNQLAERLQFDLSKRIRTYSTGNKRKLGLILAMMHDPELLILDEPTSGLDPLMQQTFNEMIHEAKAAGRTVFLSSHVLSEVQAICDRVGILRGGVLQSVQRVNELTQADFRTVTVRLRDSAETAQAALAALPIVSGLHRYERTLTFELHGDFDPVLRALNGQYIVSLDVEKPTLEAIFLKFYDNPAPAPARTETPS